MDTTGWCISLPRRHAIQAICCIGVLFSSPWGARAAADAPVLRLLHVVETQETLGLPNEAGLVFPAGEDTLLALDASSHAGRLHRLVEPDAELSSQPAVSLPDAINLALDADGRILGLDAATHELTVLSATGGVERFDLSYLKLRDARGISVDPSTGNLYVLDGQRRIMVVRPGPGRDDRARAARGHVDKLQLPRDWVALRGIAFDPETGRLQLYSPQTRELFELDARASTTPRSAATST